MACIAAIASGRWDCTGIRLRPVSQQLNVRFEERLAERTRIARELHDTLLQGFVSASMQLHVAADRASGRLSGETATATACSI